MQTTARAIEYETGLDLKAVDDIAPTTLDELLPEERLAEILSIQGDLTPYLSNQQLAAISGQCLQDYRDDCTSREDWEEKAKLALKRAKQEPEAEKTWPWKGASNASFPLLTTAALQFAARALPAVARGDEAIFAKPVGKDKGQPHVGPDGLPMALVEGQPMSGTQVAQKMAAAQAAQDEQAMQALSQAEVAWKVPPGAKAKRSRRVATYLNYLLFYRMKGWKAGCDDLLHALPIVGCGFRKVYRGDGPRSDYVPALKLVAPTDAKSCAESPRLTEIRDGLRLNDIVGDMRRGHYREVALTEQEDDRGLRTLLEQHCLLDLDDDGYGEPYVVTLDETSGEVLRVEANYGPQDVTTDGERVVGIERECYYVKYDFLPNLDGGFYGMGLGHLLDNITKIVNNTINQMIDAGTAAAAGGGFIGSGVDLSSGGKRSSRIMFEPGVYRTVSATGSALREAFYERTFPGPNPVTFQVLDLMLGAAKDISSVKDVLTGEARNTGQVGTTMALIEQGLQVFTSIFERISRSLREEFEKLYTVVGDAGDADDYAKVLDDPEADFEADFAAEDYDIRPVSDPRAVTSMQRAAQAQYLGQFLGAPGMNSQKIITDMLEMQGFTDVEDYFAPPPEPDPLAMAAGQAKVAKDAAAADKDTAQAEATRAEVALKAEEEGRKQLALLGETFRKGFELATQQ